MSRSAGTAPEAHETPIFLLLPPGTPAAAGILALLSDEAVQHVAWPALWCMDKLGIDLAARVPGVRAIDDATLPRVLEALQAAADEEALDAYTARVWRTIPEKVRDFYLGRSAMSAFAASLRLGSSSRNRPAPDAFRRDRVYDASFQVAYRLARAPGAWEPTAPAEEGTVSFYPFDPTGLQARVDANVERSDVPAGVLLELYGYAAGRDRHVALAERVAGQHADWLAWDTAHGAEGGL